MMENEIHLLIWDEFQRGATEEEAFKSICLQKDVDPPSDLMICNWFKRTHENDIIPAEEIGEEHHDILFSIISQYTKFIYAIFHREVSDYGSETFIQPRFNIDVNKTKLELFDSYNEKSRGLQHKIIKPENDEFYFPTMLIHDRMLLIMGDSGVDHLFLLDIGLHDKKCSVLDKIALDFICLQIIVDSMTSMKFLLRESDDENPLVIRIGQVVEDKIVMERLRIDFGIELFYCKLKNDKLFAFQHENNVSKFVEYDLGSNPPRKLNEWTCFADLIPGIFQHREKFFWSDSKLYVACQTYDDHPIFSIAIFDFNSHNWSNAKFIGAGDIYALTVDEDEILIISATENLHSVNKPKLKTIYHFPMRKPDRLRYLAWKKIRRDALFFGSKFYKKFLLCLPFNSEFRPFAEDG